MSLTGKIKNFLKRFLPPPTLAFNREIERVLEAVQKGQVDSAALQAQQEASFSSMQQDISSLIQMTQDADRKVESALIQMTQDVDRTVESALIQMTQDVDRIAAAFLKAEEERKEQVLTLQRNIKDIERIISNKPVYWTNEFERRVVKENWGDVTAKQDFAEKFLRLTAGMDAISVEAIIRILLRQKKYLNSDQNSIDLFTRKEQEEMRLLNENFNSEILKLSENLYAYKNYLLPINHFESSVFYYKHGLAQVKTLDKVKGKAIVDAGGFIGDSVLVLSELLPSAIYTFEAVPENFELLKKTIRLNHIENVVAENVALGAEPGTLSIYVQGSGSSPVERPGINYKEKIEVPVITLDDYVAEQHLDIGLIKVDIEGGEPAFLAGAMRTICEQKPILLLSIYHNAHDFFELKPLIESWNLGYTFSIHKPTYGNATSETLLLAEIL